MNVFRPHPSPTLQGAWDLQCRLGVTPLSPLVTPVPDGYRITFRLGVMRSIFGPARTTLEEQQLCRDAIAKLDAPEPPSPRVAKSTKPVATVDPYDPTNFAPLIDREPHIRIALDLLRDGQHVLFAGPPSGGKTLMLRCLEKHLEPENCWSLDIPRVTGAGLVNELLANKDVPRYLLCEEIEKCKPQVLEILLGLMDDRKELRRTDARGDVTKRVDSLIVASCNSTVKLSRKVAGAAILSRFGVPLPCENPDRVALVKILIGQGYEVSHVEKVVEFLFTELDSLDARLAKSLLASRDRLPEAFADYRRLYGLKAPDGSVHHSLDRLHRRVGPRT